MSIVTSNVKAFLAKSYDIVIVGGGTAGLAVASRLSENKDIHVGVLEAGPDKSDDPLLSSGGGWFQTSADPQYQWGFSSTVQENLVNETSGENGRALTLPRGKVLGGSSSINAMIWMRASRGEYDALEKTFGNPGWNFDSLLPYFRKSQSHTPLASPIFPGSAFDASVHGSQGPIKTSHNWWHSTLVAPFVNTLKPIFGVNPNPDSGNLLGVSNIARNVDPKTSKRQSSLSSYLKIAEGRSNVSVLVGAHAHNIVFAEGSDVVANGVKFQFEGAEYTVKAKKEVILSSGTYQTPQILELSGIGQRSVLDKFGIKSRVELPVGENLQDHLMIYLNYKIKDEAILKQSQDGKEALLPLGLTVQCVGVDGEEKDVARNAAASVTGNPFVASRLDTFLGSDEKLKSLVSTLDELLAGDITPLTRAQYQLQRHWLTHPQENISEVLFIFACLPGLAAIPTPDGGMSLWLPVSHLHPASRGSVHITSTDPLKAPKIDLQALNKFDLQVFTQLAKSADSLVRKEPLASLLDLQAPPTDAEFEGIVRKTANVEFHPIGTAPMAPRELGGVVDSNLKVYGTKNLRIVDASVFPLQIGSMPQASIYAFSEKAAEIIKKNL